MLAPLLLLLTTAVSSPGAAPEPAPVIDVYTFGPGAPLFERFGHAAICVTHSPGAPGSPVWGARCYNYGTTDFGSPPRKIGGDFLMGRARFWVSEWSLEQMLSAYVAADRSIWRQRLPLSPAAAQRAAARLRHDALPENREYLYHHLDDNCSTRVRDVLDEATGGALTGAVRPGTGDSFRALARRLLRDQTLLIAVADVAVGRRVDRAPDTREAMFLPDALRAAVSEHLGATPELLYQRRAPLPPAGAGSLGAWSIVLGVETLLLLPPLWLLRRPQRSRGRRVARRALLVLLGLGTGLVGLALWGAAAITTVPELRWNEALLVLLPVDLALPFLPERLRSGYARARVVGLLLVSLLLAVGVLRQPLLLPALVVLLPMGILARAPVSR